jgi:hypothetical protein
MQTHTLDRAWRRNPLENPGLERQEGVDHSLSRQRGVIALSVRARNCTAAAPRQTGWVCHLPDPPTDSID